MFFPSIHLFQTSFPLHWKRDIFVYKQTSYQLYICMYIATIRKSPILSNPNCFTRKADWHNRRSMYVVIYIYIIHIHRDIYIHICLRTKIYVYILHGFFVCVYLPTWDTEQNCRLSRTKTEEWIGCCTVKATQ